MYDTIWSTAEGIAWSKGFCYQEYYDIICPSYNVKPVSVTMYWALCMAFEDEMDREIG